MPERQRLHLDRGTLGNRTGRASFHLMPVIDHMRAHLRAADRIFVDDTRAPVLDPGRKATKSGISGSSCPTIADMAVLPAHGRSGIPSNQW
ncbi:transposase [Paracoccus sp. PAMC 22219]|uniref:IS66 family transposase n=1 Tax=Paracoccus sp. PAMC 22219 TaxID=1569209 RepID=UPI0009E056AE|nr:transposase [Paracoccus sp. PAMC 22219]